MNRVLLCGVTVALAFLAAACPQERSALTGSPGPSGSPGLERPEVELPDEAPDELVIEDLEEGSGPRAVKGSTVTVHYVGVSFTRKEIFDESYTQDRPFTLTLGAGEVIKGWDQGLVGMREGGRRKLIIPPDLGYGERGAGAAIPPGDTLVFVVDLLEVQTPAATPERNRPESTGSPEPADTDRPEKTETPAPAETRRPERSP